ncbi:MAG: hypothetical protein EXS64_21020 [Candidatus Latescibacteria bacterium]|nr:hypothetical protein [Candidatus Latescibacterota bacterium]
MPAPKGHARWGGRKEGTPNRVNVQTRREIEEQADPVGFLCQIVNGQEIDGERPTLDQRMQAARILAGKVLPDLRAVEVDDRRSAEREVTELSEAEIDEILTAANRGGEGEEAAATDPAQSDRLHTLHPSGL